VLVSKRRPMRMPVLVLLVMLMRSRPEEGHGLAAGAARCCAVCGRCVRRMRQDLGRALLRGSGPEEHPAQLA
jgi:hypothetical protein